MSKNSYRYDRLAATRDDGFRSGSEKRTSDYLNKKQIPYAYEPEALKYIITKNATYTPDFVLECGIILEVKGWFRSKDRTKHLNIRKDRPDLDIRFVFDNPNAKLSKTSSTTYAKWCEKKGFKYCKGPTIPEEWTY